MPAKDIYHESIIIALKREGWKITDDPLVLKSGGVRLMIDLGAEQMIGAEKGSEKIAVEIKSFVAFSIVQAFHEAIGQYRNYESVLRKEETNRILYLAVSSEIYQIFTQKPFFKERLEEEKVKLIVFNTETNAITTWKK